MGINLWAIPLVRALPLFKGVLIFQEVCFIDYQASSKLLF